MAVQVLTCADGRDKTALSRQHAQAWRDAREAGTPPQIGRADPPLHPARPDKPETGLDIIGCGSP